MGTTRIALPDIEVVAALVHLDWMQRKRDQGVDSAQTEVCEELMVPYHQLSEEAKDVDRGIVKSVYAAIQAAAS